MHLLQAGVSLHGLLRGSWQESDLADLSHSMPTLSRRIESVAGSTRFGTGRPTTGVAQAAMLLGQDRVKHVALWHMVLDQLDEDGISEALALGGHGLIAAEAHRFDVWSGLSVGLSARLGQRLLLQRRTPVAAVLRLFEASGGGALLEEVVFGDTRDSALHHWTQELSIPNDLSALLRPVPGSAAHALVEAVLAQAGGDETWSIPRVAHELARMLGVRVRPVPAVRGADAGAVVAAVAEVLAEREQLDERIETLRSDVAALKEELEAASGSSASGLLGPGEVLERVHMEVARARRYKRHLSLVAVAVEPSDYPIDARFVLEHLAERFQAGFRSSDAAGIFDQGRLIVILPETPVTGARLFSERTEYALRKTPMEHDGVVIPLRPRLFGSSLEQQGEQDADGMLFSVLDGVEAMTPGERVRWNTHGQSVWRVNG
ncbi:MAG TPA: hypothetical protein QGF58_26830 [Myxococcota bacterium]|nr:hypothetical protein [Myxococcota bacterium]